MLKLKFGPPLGPGPVTLQGVECNRVNGCEVRCQVAMSVGPLGTLNQIDYEEQIVVEKQQGCAGAKRRRYVIPAHTVYLFIPTPAADQNLGMPCYTSADKAVVLASVLEKAQQEYDDRAG